MNGVEVALSTLLGLATLAPLISFFVILCFGSRMKKAGGAIATTAITFACALSFIALFIWLPTHPPSGSHHTADAHHSAGEHSEEKHSNGDSKEPGRHNGDADAAEKHSAVGQPAPLHDNDVQLTQVSLTADTTKAVGEGEADESSDHHHEAKAAYTDDYYVLGQFGKLKLSISYYIDALTVAMFCMVTLIATCIHFYATGYMHEELHDPVTDHEVATDDGHHLERPGRYPRFFQYMSLFCFSMLGLVLAGNIAMVFVFWELVGICSYFLIGFYIERRSAQVAANKAFIVNRVGDFGMIIGLMALWASLGTFAFGDTPVRDATTGQVVKDDHGHVIREAGIFSQVRPPEKHNKLQTPDGMVRLAAGDRASAIVRDHLNEYRIGNFETREAALGAADAQIAAELDEQRESGVGYWLLIVAGVGIFCGCVGKSAQFPLHVWLPDAMEGPTPVSALVHSATMVAAGVYLVGRFYPVFAPEVLLVIAIVGTITLFLAATIAITATDIKRVLAYSTVSQLGYMMMALGVGGWLAGMMHLITHAFFKSLLFLCSGSVIHAVHTNEMPQMGGLLKKMPVTAITMLIGCLAIAGASLPLVVGLSGYYSKDSILEQAFSFAQSNAVLANVFFVAAAGGAAITAFYMFRLWFMTFTGKPRDEHRFEHAHESPPSMYVPLIVLATFAVVAAWGAPEASWKVIFGAIICMAIAGYFAMRYKPAVAAHHPDEHDAHDHGHGGLPSWLIYLPLVISGIVFVLALIWLFPGIGDVTLANILEGARPEGTATTVSGMWTAMTWPNEHLIHEDAAYIPIKVPVTMLAFGTAVVGIGLAAMFYWWRRLEPGEVRRQFEPVYRLLWNKWWFDELYDFLFVRPVLALSRIAAAIDRQLIDWFVDGLAKVTAAFSRLWDAIADRTIVDGLINLAANWTYSIGLALRWVQGGRLRQYVMYIVLGTLVIFLLVSFFWNPTLASGTP